MEVTEKGVFKMKMNQKQLLALGISMMLGAGMLTGCAAAADSSLSKATGQGNAAAGSTSADASDAGTEADEGTSAADAGATKTDSAANIDAGVDSGHTTISAEASDYVMASPDQASVNFSIETTAKTAKDAQSQNTKQMDALIDTLSGLGVGEDAIYTPDYSLYPTYDNYGNNIVGYKVSSTLAVKDQSIDEMEKLIAGCTDAGVTSISGVNYYYSGYSDAYDKALAAAVKKAAQKAQVLAQAAGAELGSMVSITENDNSTDTDGGGYYNMTSSEAMSSDMKIIPQDQKITAKVTVVYTLK